MRTLSIPEPANAHELKTRPLGKQRVKKMSTPTNRFHCSSNKREIADCATKSMNTTLTNCGFNPHGPNNFKTLVTIIYTHQTQHAARTESRSNPVTANSSGAQLHYRRRARSSWPQPVYHEYSSMRRLRLCLTLFTTASKKRLSSEPSSWTTYLGSTSSDPGRASSDFFWFLARRTLT